MTRLKIAYLVGQFPAINHYYLLQEVRALGSLGIDVRVASVNPPDRSPDQLKPEEREELSGVYCLKREKPSKVAAALMTVFLSAPVRFCRAFALACSVARSQRKSLQYAGFYFAEAVLAGRWLAKCGITHLHASFTSNLGLIAAELFPITFSFGVYGFGELYDPINNRLRDKIARSLFVRSVSRDGVGQLMLACPPEHWPRLVYVPLGIDPPSQVPPRRPERSGPFEVLCVGRLSPEKGYRILFRAIALLRGRGEQVIVRLVGDGPDRGGLESEIAALDLSGHIVFEGWVDQDRLDALYAETDAFVSPSLYEGIPIVLMEAMARAAPCIAARINGVPELITHGETGLLFSPADHDELAALIASLIQSPSRGAEMGGAARERVLRDFDINRNTIELAGVFREKLGVAL